MSLIAIATSDGVKINGRIDAPGVFFLYRFDSEGRWEEVGQRSTPRSPRSEHLLLLPQAAALLLADVDVILALQVPKVTAAFMRTRGILAYGVRGTVEEALQSYSRRGRLLESLLAHIRKVIGRPAPTETRVARSAGIRVDDSDGAE